MCCLWTLSPIFSATSLEHILYKLDELSLIPVTCSFAVSLSVFIRTSESPSVTFLRDLHLCSSRWVLMNSEYSIIGDKMKACDFQLCPWQSMLFVGIRQHSNYLWTQMTGSTETVQQQVIKNEIPIMMSLCHSFLSLVVQNCLKSPSGHWNISKSFHLAIFFLPSVADILLQI